EEVRGAGRDARERLRPAADRDGGAEPAVLPPHSGIRETDGSADALEHVFQRERAGRVPPRGSARLLPQDQDGRPRARRPDAGAELMRGGPLAVSLVTVVRNGAKTLRDCIRSVRAQTHPVEHFVIDGGSSDGTVE